MASSPLKSSTTSLNTMLSSATDVCLDGNASIADQTALLPPKAEGLKVRLVDNAESIEQGFEFGKVDARTAVNKFLRQMTKRLAKDGSRTSQIPSYVTALPTGSERGVYLAIDIGGTNFRVCSVRLNGDRTFSVTEEKVAIPPKLMIAETVKELFNFFAQQVDLFLQKHHREHLLAHRKRIRNLRLSKSRPFHRMGVTFSFAVDQQGIRNGLLLRWSKGFHIPDGIGKDICVLLQEALDALQLPVLVTALTNDTVGTLMTRAYTSPFGSDTILGAVFGTGSNGAYMEKFENIGKLSSATASSSHPDISGMIINTEWASFFDDEPESLPNTIYDNTVDILSVNPGLELFEKRVSGMYLGEVLRQAMLSILEPYDELGSDSPRESPSHCIMVIDANSPIYTEWGIDTSLLSIMAADNSKGLHRIEEELRTLGIECVNIRDLEIIKCLAQAIAKRAARLAGVAISAVIIKSGRLVQRDCNKSVVTETRSEVQESWTASKPRSFFRALLSRARRLLKFLALSIKIPISRRRKYAEYYHASTVPEPVESSVLDIGIDGSFAEFYPGFEDEIRSTLRDIEEIGVEGEKRVRIGISKGGGSVGAALVALIADGQSNIDDTKA